jgi:cation:H+ antiporter
VVPFDALPLWLLIAIFALASLLVWGAGTKLAYYATEIAQRTGISGAVVGLVLLGFVTSLPEVATAGTAAIRGNADLAVNNLLGGVSFQIVVLAAADAAIRRHSLTGTLPASSVMLQAVLCIIMLTVALAGTITGDPEVMGVGLWSFGLVLIYLAGIFLLHKYDGQEGWAPARVYRSVGKPERDQTGSSPSAGQLALLTFGAAALIVVSGYVLTRSAETIAEATGLGSALGGLVLLAFATSLPELSSAIAAVRLRQPGMAIGDVFGGNIADIALIFLVDAIYDGEPVLNSVSSLTALAALLGILLCSIYLVGMIKRVDRAVGRLGYDSIAILATYGAGLVLLYNMRPA